MLGSEGITFSPAEVVNYQRNDSSRRGRHVEAEREKQSLKVITRQLVREREKESEYRRGGGGGGYVPREGITGEGLLIAHEELGSQVLVEH